MGAILMLSLPASFLVGFSLCILAEIAWQERGQRRWAPLAIDGSIVAARACWLLSSFAPRSLNPGGGAVGWGLLRVMTGHAGIRMRISACVLLI